MKWLGRQLPRICIAACAGVVTALGLGAAMPRWMQFALTAATAIWALNVWLLRQFRELNRSTIKAQMAIIDDLRDMLTDQQVNGHERDR